jgi:DNA-binding winged helix-turn-helix (wHTH) protein/tetratricopeptide (TPR) repeat protein
MADTFQIGDWVVEPQLNSLTDAERTSHVEPRAMQVLVCLAEHAGEVISKERLIRAVWADTFVGEDVLTRTISQLRKAFGDDAKEQRFIQTIPKGGYRLLVPVVYEPVKQETNLQGKVALTAAPKASHRRWWSSGRVLVTCVIAVGTVAAALYAWTFNQPKQPEAATIKSIAVLPFKPLVADNGDEALELGMADTVILKLSNLRDIIVRPLSSVRKYTALDRDPIAAGRELGVDAVVDASIQTAGKRVRMSWRLLRVIDGATLWSDKCDEQHCANLFEMQDAIAEKVAGSLILQLGGVDRELLAKRYTDNAEAFRLYSRGRYLFNQWTRESMKKSLEYYQQAMEKDRNYALAYSGMADAYNQLGTGPKAREAALKALEIDEKLAEAHAALGKIRFIYDWDLSGAEKELKRAIELDPNLAEAHSAFGVYLSIVGRLEEAVAEAGRGQELDPFSQFANFRFAMRLYDARHYDEAIEQFRRGLEIDPNFGSGHRSLARVFLLKGMDDEAVTEFEAAERLSGGNPELRAARAKAYKASGMKGYLHTCLEQMKEAAKQRLHAHLSLVFDSGAPSALDFAGIYTFLGEKDQALEWLRRAYEEHDNNLIYIKADPMYDGMRGDPRFTDLLRRLGLLTAT